jgi:iron complex outermembrane receptor protein
MIEILTALLLDSAGPPARLLRVRDTAVALPDSGAAAAAPDTSLHAVSRTPGHSGAAGTARAAELPRPVVTLPAAHVDATLERARRRAPTAFVTTLRNDPGRSALASLGDVLVEAAGVRVAAYGGMGAFSTMSLRGAPPGHVTVLLDGVPLTSASHGVVDLANLPATAIEAVEVYRGPSPVSLAAPTPGGAVNLLSRAAAGVRELRLAAGSFGTAEAQGSLGARHGAWSLLAHGGWQGSDGDYRFLDDNTTPLEPADDAMRARENARFDAASALVRGGWAPGDRAQAAARVEYFRRGQGVPGPGGTPALTARFASERLVFSGEARTALGGTLPPGVTNRSAAGSPVLEARAHLARETSRLRDTNSELGLGMIDTNERFGDTGGSLELASPAGWRLFGLRAGAAFRAEHARPAAPTGGLPDPPRSTRETRATWAGAQLGGADTRALLHAHGRWDRQVEHVRDTRSTGALRERDSERTLVSPQLGARLRAGLGLELRANWSRGARAPEFDELFGIDGSVTGNPTLLPERAESWDAGFGWSGEWRAVRVGVEWSHHATHATDLVLYERSSPRGARPVNVAAARLRGEEASLRGEWRGLELAAATAWLSATDRSPYFFYHGRRLPQRAERQSHARLSWRGRDWSASGDVEYLGDTYLHRSNLERSPSRTLAGVSLGRRVGRARLLVEGRNLTDRLVQDVAGFPLPGRMLLVSLSLDLGEGRATP